MTVIIIALLAKTKNFYIAGLAPLFPTFAIIAHYIVGKERSVSDLQKTALFGICALVPYFVYLLSVYLLCTKMSLAHTIIVSTGAWVLTAMMLLLLWK
ncbi:MAG: GlpM family protein [Spirochaetota bacterium]|nr:GlpM family protein [Spirochaetota bacterium]